MAGLPGSTNFAQPLGFKLLPKKEPLEVIVINHVEMPSAN
jgi:uncharacterized protein (TIGR03435 family)